MTGPVRVENFGPWPQLHRIYQSNMLKFCALKRLRTKSRHIKDFFENSHFRLAGERMERYSEKKLILQNLLLRCRSIFLRQCVSGHMQREFFENYPISLLWSELNCISKTIVAAEVKFCIMMFIGTQPRYSKNFSKMHLHLCRSWIQKIYRRIYYIFKDEFFHNGGRQDIRKIKELFLPNISLPFSGRQRMQDHNFLDYGSQRIRKSFVGRITSEPKPEVIFKASWALQTKERNINHLFI